MDWLHQHYEVLSLLVAAVAAFLTWLQFRKREPSTSSASQSTIDRSAVVTGSNNQITIGAVSAPPPERRSEAPRVPNLVFTGAKQRTIYIGQYAQEGICDPRTLEQQSHSFPALVFKFENRISSDRKIAVALNVIAKVKFFHKNGVTWREIDYGVWLNSPCNSTSIGIGDTRELVLVCDLDEHKNVTFEDKRVDGTYFSSPWSYFDTPDINGYDRVEVTVIDKSTQASLTVKQRFWRQGNSFCTSEE